MHVTLDGYAVEGGYDGPHQPATCLTPTISQGRHEGPGDGALLWRDYERVLESLARMRDKGLPEEEAVLAAFEENARSLSRADGN